MLKAEIVEESTVLPEMRVSVAFVVVSHIVVAQQQDQAFLRIL
jgi:hypothetical protein